MQGHLPATGHEITQSVREEIERQIWDFFEYLSDEEILGGVCAEARLSTDDGGLFYTRTDLTDWKLPEGASRDEVDALCASLQEDAMARLRWYESEDDAMRAYAHGCF